MPRLGASDLAHVIYQRHPGAYGAIFGIRDCVHLPRATVRWAPSTDNVGVAYYDIYHDGQLIKTVDGTEHEAAIETTPGAVWGVYVNARDAAGNVSQASTSVTARVPQCSADNIPHTVPSGLQGSVNGTSVTLSWNASTDNVGVVAYDLFRNGSQVGSTPNLSFADSGLPPNTALQYAVAARDAQNNSSGPSGAVSVHTSNACTTPVCKTSQVSTDTDVPWGLVHLPDGSVLYTRRDAHDVVKLDPSTGLSTSVGTVPNVESTDGEGGLLGLAVTAQFPLSDPWIYLYHTSPTDNRIVGVKYVNGRLDLKTLQPLLTGIGRNKFHNGGRLRFGPDGKLYASVGDAQNGAFAQGIRNLSGKILRLNADGSVPSDNPFGNYIWSYGHRNPQGLAFDSSGRLWEQEFGNNAQDETNLIVKGGNYGWPDCEGTQSQSGKGCQTPGFTPPKFTYPTAEGSCSGLTIVRDVIYVACLRGTRMYRESINGSNVGEVQQFFNGVYGRLRTIEPSNDGGLFLTTSNAGDKDSVPNNSNEKVLKITLGQ